MVTAIAGDFEWTRAYANRDEAGYRCVKGELRQIGRHKDRPYEPFKIDGLYLKLAALDGSPEDCVAFANTWGLLEKPASLTNPPSESLEFWRREIRRMKGNIAMLPFVIKASAPSTNYRAVTQAIVGSIDVLLVPNTVPGEKPRLVLKPHSLLQAMNLQLALWVTGGGTLITCEQCGRPFQAGIGKKRSIARFCSDLCRVQHHRRVKV
jgi:hypothetical protein